MTRRPEGEPRTEDFVVVVDLEILARFRSSRSTGTSSLVSPVLFLLLSSASRCSLRAAGSSRSPRPVRRRSLFPLRSRGSTAVGGRGFGTLWRPFTRTGLDARRNLEVFLLVVIIVIIVIIVLVVNVLDCAFVRGRCCPGQDVVPKSAPALHPPSGVLKGRQRAATASVRNRTPSCSRRAEGVQAASLRSRCTTRALVRVPEQRERERDLDSPPSLSISLRTRPLFLRPVPACGEAAALFSSESEDDIPTKRCMSRELRRERERVRADAWLWLR